MGPAVRWDPAAYEDAASVQFEWGKKVLDRRSWRGDETVLDAGCGTGALAEEILRRVPRGSVVAVDADPDMVSAARRRLSKAGARAQVLQADLQHLPPLSPVDVIFSNAVLHWVPDHDATFETFLKHLKPGGELLVQCGGEGNLERIRGLTAQLLKAAPFEGRFAGWKPPWHYEDDASTQERLFIAGFVHPEVSLEPAPAQFPDAASFRKFAEAVVLRPLLSHLEDAGERKAFVDEFMRRVGSRPQDLVFDYVRLNIRAQRSPHHS